MIGLYILAGIIIFFILLMQVSTSVRIRYNSTKAESLKIYAKIGFYKLNIIPPKPKKAKKPKKVRKKNFRLFKKKKVDEIAQKKFEDKQKKDKPKYTIKEIISVSKDLSLVFFQKLKKYLKITVYKININAGAEDAYKTAVLYANINQAAYFLYEILRNNFNLNVQNININPDFFSEKVNFDIDIKAGIKIGGSVNMLIAMAMSFVKFRSKSKKNNNVSIKKERVEINGGQ